MSLFPGLDAAFLKRWIDVLAVEPLQKDAKLGENAGRVGELELATALQPSPFAQRIPEIMEASHRLFYEKPAKRLSES